MLNLTGRTYSHNGMLDCPRPPISEMHLGKLPDSMEFQNWKIDVKNEVCKNSESSDHYALNQRS